MEEKLDLIYKFAESEQRKVNSHKMLRGIFSSWANLFLIFRPVKNMSYYKISHMILLQPLRFLINFITLIILIILTWSPVYFHNRLNFYNSGLQIDLTIVFIVVLISGIFNLVEIICYFYYGNCFLLSKMPTKKDDIEMQSVHKEEINTENKNDDSLVKNVVENNENNLSNVLTIDETAKTLDISPEEEEKTPL